MVSFIAIYCTLGILQILLLRNKKHYPIAGILDVIAIVMMWPLITMIFSFNYISGSIAELRNRRRASIVEKRYANHSSGERMKTSEFLSYRMLYSFSDGNPVIGFAMISTMLSLQHAGESLYLVSVAFKTIDSAIKLWFDSTELEDTVFYAHHRNDDMEIIEKTMLLSNIINFEITLLKLGLHNVRDVSAL